MKPFEIFAPGTHTSMSGETITFGAAELDGVVSSYNTDLHEAPIVIGHPQHDHPAYGWVKSVRVEGGRLVATPAEVDPAFAELVDNGRYKKVSAAFYRPDAPNNPKPGSYYLRHVGFLGAQPPALKGLKPVAFADDADQVVVFGEVDAGAVARLFRGMREFLISKFGGDAEGMAQIDRALSPWDVDQVSNPANPAYADPPAPTETEMSEKTQAALDARAAQLAEREAAFAEREKAQQRASIEIMLDKHVTAGRLLPAEKVGALAFAAGLDAAGTVEFADAGGKPVKTASLAWFDGFLGGLPNRVEYAELTADKGGDVPGFVPPAGFGVDLNRAELHAKALAYQEQHKGTDYVTAVRAVGGK